MAICLGTVDEHERRRKSALELACNHVHHLGCVPNGIEPEVVGNLVHGEVSTGHVNYSFPMSLNKTI